MAHPSRRRARLLEPVRAVSLSSGAAHVASSTMAATRQLRLTLDSRGTLAHALVSAIALTRAPAQGRRTQRHSCVRHHTARLTADSQGELAPALAHHRANCCGALAYALATAIAPKSLLPGTLMRRRAVAAAVACRVAAALSSGF